MKTICLTNNKGGVAKTVTTLNLAHYLTTIGKRVLLVDLDPQANLTSFFCPVPSLKGTSYDLLNGREAHAYERRKNLFLIPSEAGLTAFEAEHVGDVEREVSLKKGLKEFQKEGFDFCFIDTPPAVGSLLVNALSASDFYLIPTTVDGFSVQGVAQVINIANKTKKTFNKDLKLAGVLLTMYDRKRNVTKSGEEFLRQMLGKETFKSTIRNSVSVREAVAQGRTLLEGRKSPVREDIEAVAEELLKRIGNAVKTHENEK